MTCIVVDWASAWKDEVVGKVKYEMGAIWRDDKEVILVEMRLSEP